MGASASTVSGCGNTGGSAAGGAGTGTAGTSMAGTSAAGAGTASGGTAPGGGAHSGGGSGATAGASGGALGGSGAGGTSATGTEIAVSLTACMPACPDQQYCALVGPACTTEPCEVHAVCRDRPACGAEVACPVAPQNTCRDDPSDSCNPASGMTCPGRCFRTEGAHPCGAQALERRPDICACVTPGTTMDCLDVNCPGNDLCDIVLGKAYCIIPS
ncbi:MAG: hypothetical protein ABI488_13020 [Polyangiaceae bacterium]